VVGVLGIYEGCWGWSDGVLIQSILLEPLLGIQMPSTPSELNLNLYSPKLHTHPGRQSIEIHNSGVEGSYG
jgi:hypothetical protein